MAKYKVRHALLSYTLGRGGQGTGETAFRGMIVDIPADQAERFLALGAIVPEDAELDRPGTMVTLREAPTDEELINWVAGATDTEVQQLVLARPSMAHRVANIQETVKKRYDAQAELLGERAKLAEAQAGEFPAVVGQSAMLDESVTAPAPATPVPSVAPVAPVPPTAAAASAAAAIAPALPVDVDAVVRGTVGEVSKFVSENPQLAAQVLEAETRLATEKNDQPRQGVVRAVQVAAGHTS